MFEKIIFSVLALAFFTITFLNLIKKNDTSYICILIIEFIGITMSFIELIFNIKFNLILKIIIYIFSIVIPTIMLWLEQNKKIDFPELFNITMAKILSKSGHQEQAKSIVCNFLNKNNNSYYAHKWLAKYYEEKQNFEAAISEYMRVIDIRKNDFLSVYKLSNVLNKNKQNDQAIELLEELLKQKPAYEQASNLLGEIFCEQEMYKEASSVYMLALRYNPASYNLYYNLGMTYTMLNDFQRAKEFYEKAAEINTLAYNIKLNLGQIALIYGEMDEAEEYFMQAAKQEDLETGSYYYLSQIALLKGDEEKAKNYMNVAIELDPTLYNKVQKDPVFNPIKNKINLPKDLTKVESMCTLSNKEKLVNKHLMKTCILVKNLSKEDIKNAKISISKHKKKDEKQKE